MAKINIKFNLDGIKASKLNKFEIDKLYEKMEDNLPELRSVFSKQLTKDDGLSFQLIGNDSLIPEVEIKNIDDEDLKKIKLQDYFSTVKTTFNKILKRLVIINKNDFTVKITVSSEDFNFEESKFIYNFYFEKFDFSDYKEDIFSSIKKVLTGLALSSLFACGSDDYMNPKTSANMPPLPQSDPFFTPYIKKLENEFSAIEGKNVKFDNIPFIFSSEVRSSALAACVRSLSDPNYKYIAFNPSLEEKLKNGVENNPDLASLLELTIKHEIGHCYYLREHEVTIKLTKENLEIMDSDKNWFAKKNRIGEIKAFIPQSLMYPIYSYATVMNYKKLTKYYNEELVKKNPHLKDVLESKLADLVPNDKGELKYRSPSNMKFYVLKDKSGGTILETSDATAFYNGFYEQMFLTSKEDQEEHNHELEDILNQYNLCGEDH